MRIAGRVLPIKTPLILEPALWPFDKPGFPPVKVCSQVKQQKVSSRTWKKEKAAERLQRQYKTADEVLAEQGDKASAVPTNQTILDMTGRQARVITNMDELKSGGASSLDDDLPMPELQHNLRVMVDLAAADIQRLDGKLRHSKVWLPSMASKHVAILPLPPTSPFESCIHNSLSLQAGWFYPLFLPTFLDFNFIHSASGNVYN